MASPSQQPVFSDELEHWLTSDADKTLGSLVDLFGEKGFATVFVLLLAVPAFPLPTAHAVISKQMIPAQSQRSIGWAGP